jgi:hypothetical protein
MGTERPESACQTGRGWFRPSGPPNQDRPDQDRPDQDRCDQPWSDQGGPAGCCQCHHCRQRHHCCAGGGGRGMGSGCERFHAVWRQFRCSFVQFDSGFLRLRFSFLRFRSSFRQFGSSFLQFRPETRSPCPAAAAKQPRLRSGRTYRIYSEQIGMSSRRRAASPVARPTISACRRNPCSGWNIASFTGFNRGPVAA